MEPASMALNTTYKDFHFIEDDPLHRFVARRLRVTKTSKPYFLLLFAFLVAYLPLLIFSYFEGTLSSHFVDVPLVRDYALQMRFLLAAPILIMSRPIIQRTTAAVCEYTYNVLLNEEDREKVLLPAIDRIRRNNESWVTVAVMLVIVITTTLLLYFSKMEDREITSLSGWFGGKVDGEFEISPAYLWYSLVSMSFFRFMLLRWLWSYGGWVWLLFRIARCRLRLSPHHSDHACGLNLLVFPQGSFNLLFVALAIVSSGMFINNIVYLHQSFELILIEVGILIGVSFVMLLGPYLFFTPKLFAARRLTNFNMARKSHQLSEDYDREWISTTVTGIQDEKPDPSVMIDFYSTYENTEKIRPFVFDHRDLITLAVPIMLSFLPTLLTKMSFRELLEIVMRFVV